MIAVKCWLQIGRSILIKIQTMKNIQTIFELDLIYRIRN